jgi:hypothetical protein
MLPKQTFSLLVDDASAVRVSGIFRWHPPLSHTDEILPVAQ